MPSYRNPSTGKWYCKFYYTDYQGKKKQKKKEGFALKREAEAFERDFFAKHILSTGGNLHACLSKMFNHAVRFYKLSKKPASIAGSPKVPDRVQKQKRFWTLDQFNKIIPHVEE